MATTKRARYFFRVSEGMGDVSIVTDHRGSCEGFDPPLGDGGFIFDLREGTSMAEAKKVADFLNGNVESIGTLTFGDAEDIAIEVRNAQSTLENVKEGFSAAVVALKESITAGDMERARENLEAVAGWGHSLLDDWARSMQRFD